MAGDWIKWTKGLSRKPEVLRISSHLNISRHAAAGLLMEVWEWCDDNVEFRNFSGSDPDKTTALVSLGSDSVSILTSIFDSIFGVTGLADAMTSVGWMEIRPGTLVFPKLARHNGSPAKIRALDTRRKKKPVPSSVQKSSGSEPEKTRTREEKRREENKDPPNPPVRGDPEPNPNRDELGSIPIPSSIDTPQVRAAWADWIADRKARRKTMSARAARMQLDKLAACRPDEVVATIQASIANGWIGLFPENFRNPGSGPSRLRAPPTRAEANDDYLRRMMADCIPDPEPEEPHAGTTPSLPGRRGELRPVHEPDCLDLPEHR